MSESQESGLSLRVAELEGEVRRLRELLERVVSVDAGSGGITLAAAAVRCEELVVHEPLSGDDGTVEERDRILLFVEADSPLARIRILSESGEVAYDVEACDDFVATEHHQDGRLKLAARADAESARVVAVHQDGASVAARLGVTWKDEGAGLDVFRPDGTVAATLGIEGERSSVAVWDTQGDYRLVELANGGDDLGAVAGWRNGSARWLLLQEVEGGAGGGFFMWSDSTRESADVYIEVDADGCRAGFGTDSRQDPGIVIECDDRTRLISLNNFIGEHAVGMSVDAAGNVEHP